MNEHQEKIVNIIAGIERERIKQHMAKPKKEPVAVYTRVGSKKQLGKNENERIQKVVDDATERLFKYLEQGRIDEAEFIEYNRNMYRICEDEMKKCAARIANKFGGNING